MKASLGKAVFLILETVFYGISLLQKTEYIDEVRYASIALCFVFSLFAFAEEKAFENKKQYVVIGLFFTCISDFFLVVLNQYFAVGVGFFFIVQIWYFLYLTSSYGRTRQISILVGRIAASVALSVVLFSIIEKKDFLVLGAVFYAVFFIHNIAIGIKDFAQTPLFVVGLILFICCDICVALTNMDVIFTSFSFRNITKWLIWFFYIPSQVCISCSLVEKKLEKRA